MKNGVSTLLETINNTAIQLFDVNWTAYGSKIELYDSNDVRKYQGFLSGVGLGAIEPKIEMVGTLSDEDKYLNVLKRKFAILEHNPDFVVSAQGRNPVIGDWGGAYRVTYYKDLFTGGTGLPETVDNLIIGNSTKAHDLLTERDFEIATSFEQPHIRAMCADVGMVREAYCELCLLIEQASRSALKG